MDDTTLHPCIRSITRDCSSSTLGNTVADAGDDACGEGGVGRGKLERAEGRREPHGACSEGGAVDARGDHCRRRGSGQLAAARAEEDGREWHTRCALDVEAAAACVGCARGHKAARAVECHVPRRDHKEALLRALHVRP